MEIIWDEIEVEGQRQWTLFDGEILVCELIDEPSSFTHFVYITRYGEIDRETGIPKEFPIFDTATRSLEEAQAWGLFKWFESMANEQWSEIISVHMDDER